MIIPMSTCSFFTENANSGVEQISSKIFTLKLFLRKKYEIKCANGLLRSLLSKPTMIFCRLCFLA